MRYSILIVAFLMFNLTGYSQTTLRAGRQDLLGQHIISNCPTQAY